VTIPARKQNRSEYPKAAICEFIRTNSFLVLLNNCFNHTFSLAKPSSEMDLDASTITNKSILPVLHGIPVNVMLANGLTVGAGVGRMLDVGAKVGRFVGLAVVLIMQLEFGHTIPA
jgi:hypothetical protein